MNTSNKVNVEALLESATLIRKQAYAPYSKFLVGAAVQASDGQIFSGANVENCAYPSCLCAEHNAVGKAVSEGVRQIIAVCVVADPKAYPCGKCRQVLREFGSDMDVFVWDAKISQLEKYLLSELLPHSFGPWF